MVATHLFGVHTADAVVRVFATTTICLIGSSKFVDKIGIMHQSTSHLKKFEAFAKHLIHLSTANQTTYVDEWAFEFGTEFFSIFEEISLLEWHSRNHDATHEVKSRFEPPEFCHIHIVSQSFDRHSTTHNCHRGFAHETSRKNNTVNTSSFYFFSNLDRLRDLYTTFEAVVHIVFYNDSHIVASATHNFGKHEFHETHTIFERTTEFVFTLISIRREELRDKIAVTSMDFDAVETCLATHIDSTTKVFYKFHNFSLFQSTHNSWRVEIETR